MDLAYVTASQVDPTTNPDGGDLYVAPTGDVVTLTGDDAEAQAISVGLATWQGEWFLDLTQGVPYRTLLGVKGVTSIQIQQAIAAEILRRGTVTAITQLVVALAPDRTGTVTWAATLEDGTTIDGTAPIGPTP